MIKRSFLILIGIFLFCWIGFVSYGLLHKENAQDFRSYFSSMDGAIWAIHHPEEVNWDDHGIQTLSINQSIYSSVVPKMDEPASFIFSTKRALFLIEKSHSWKKQEIQKLFQNGLFPFELGKLNSFEYGKLHGIYKGNQLLIYEGELSADSDFVFNIDTKASFSKVLLSKQKSKNKTCDMYIKSGRIYTYTKSQVNSKKISSIDDRSVFASFIPSSIDSYSFYEKNYLTEIDPIFAQSPFAVQMISNGVVFIGKDSECAAVFDYQEEYSPIDILNEKLQIGAVNEDASSYKNVRFSGLLNTSSTELFIAQSNGFAVVSSSKDLVDFVIAEAELANTISQDETLINRLFANLPCKVASRQVSNNSQKTISIYGNKMIETSCRLIDVMEKKEANDIKDYFVMNPGERVLDFAAFPERGNVIAFTDKRKLIGFSNGLKKWEKTCSQDAISMGLIEIGQCFVSVQFANEVQLFDKTGRLVFRMTNNPKTQPVAYYAKNTLEFAIANSKTSVQLLNDKGTVIKPFQVSGDIRQLEVCNSAATPILGVRTSTMYYTIDLVKRKSISKMTIDSNYHIVNTGKELIPISLKNNSMNLIYKGKPLQFMTRSNVKLLGTYEWNKEIVFVLSRGKELYAYLLSGKILWEKSLPVQEITSMSIKQAKNGAPLLCVLDAIDNELYFMNPMGQAFDQNNRHGETKAQVSPFGTNAYSITTFLGSYLIQYTKQ
jgi:hypothetical protein